MTVGPVGHFADPAAPDLAGLHAEVGRYYAGKLKRFGPSPPGVDWSCQPTQELRFIQLLKLCAFDRPATLNDFGCGYGSLFGFLQRRFPHADIDYLGIDLSPQMILAARKGCHHPSAAFHTGTESPRTADYTVASGIFNVMLGHPVAIWEHFVATTLTHFSRTSRHGFAVNFVSRPGPGQDDAPGLYCTEPQRWVAFCKDQLGHRANVVDRYGMSEFTLIATRPEAASAPGRRRMS
ncbi:MAG: methyltransferase [Microvirga sp.]